VIRSGSLQPGTCCRLTVHTQDAQARRVVWQHFVRAILRAEKFTAENHAKTVDDIAKYLKLDRASSSVPITADISTSPLIRTSPVFRVLEHDG